jgi:hypothetical protein
VKRIAPADPRLHAQPVIGVDLVDVDDRVFVECAEVHRLACELADAAHFDVGFAHEIDTLQRLRAEFEQTDGQTVTLGLDFLRHVAERLQRLHDAMHGRLRHAEPLRQFADADLPAVADRAENREHAANRRSRFAFVAAALDAVRVVRKGRENVLTLLFAGCCHFRDSLIELLSNHIPTLLRAALRRTPRAYRVSSRMVKTQRASHPPSTASVCPCT